MADFKMMTFLRFLSKKRWGFILILLFFFINTSKIFGQVPKNKVSTGPIYLSKLTLPNETIKHTNDAVIMLNGSDSAFYFSQKAAPTHHVTEFHLFFFQKKTAKEIIIPFANELKTDRIICLDKENKTLFFKCNINGDDIYYSQAIAGKWQKPLPFAPLNSSFKESGMCISPDKKRIVFASARGNGNANLDLYLTEYQENGLWQKPRLLKTISSDQDEDDPKFSADGKTLYFASKGFNSRGKYDLFSSDFDPVSNTWRIPVNLGKGINSEYNEISPGVNSKGAMIVLSSDRYSLSGDYHLYRPVTAKKLWFSAQINDADSSLQIGNLKVSLKPEDALPGDGNIEILSETGVYADSVFANRWYIVNITDSNKVLHTERTLLNSSNYSRSYYFNLTQIKDPHLVYKGKKIPLLSKYVLRYDAGEMLPEKYNKKTLERVSELLGHLHIYQVEILYPSTMTKEQQAIVSSRVDRLQKYLIKNKASQKDITSGKLNTLEPDQLTIKMEFKLRIN